MNKNKVDAKKLIETLLRDIGVGHLINIGIMPYSKILTYPGTTLYVIDYEYEEIVRAIKSLKLEDDLEEYFLNMIKTCQKDIDKIDESLHFNLVKN